MASDHSNLQTSTIAELCLGYLAENPEDLARFMGHAGYDPSTLRQAIGTMDLTNGLIDYFASNEPILLALCANAQIQPESFMRVWHKLNPVG
ncbi:DUF3572 family protein [Devosia algicola]|uniref:DUF3572 family protein n=1 Tax=Devosia algicola TaxID=3026418 RepID=A0ABY7YSQ8_9HYPH|nr:DUF3572 family protein [Devosia algicola]WDR04227.1 DUF3572 family protein [Devosia algicola]